jgi:hypothetical protein
MESQAGIRKTNLQDGMTALYPRKATPRLLLPALYLKKKVSDGYLILISKGVEELFKF